MNPPATLLAVPARSGAVLAHQGGWDEVLLVVGPLAVVGLLLWVANKRVTAQLADAEAAAQGTTADEGAPGDQAGTPSGDDG